uniref:NB-ARC domain-containing protein n=1 Tax=Oryza glumipatula TaxID=40148 RepID=A0A0E0A8M3_9ORYZ
MGVARELHIDQCKKLEHLPPILKDSGMEIKLLPSTVEQLTIKSCGELENMLIGSLAGLQALSNIFLSQCTT